MKFNQQVQGFNFDNFQDFYPGEEFRDSDLHQVAVLY